MKNTPDGDGTLLDHSLILYGTNMGDSNQHLHYDVPHVLIGGASGSSRAIVTGVSFEDGSDRESAGSILDMYGVHEDKIGDSTGRLTNL